jgi:hypothetical protein
MSTLRRPFPLPVIMASCSLEPVIQWQTSAPTAGRGCVLKLQKSVSLTFHLNILLGNHMVLGVSEVPRGGFSGRNPIPTCIFDAERRS